MSTYLQEALERFTKDSPISVMARAVMEHAMSAEDLDAVFSENAKRQYTRELLFSTVVDVLGAVVMRSQKSVNAAYQAKVDQMAVSVTSLYNKLSRTEPAVCQALLRHEAGRLQAIIEVMGGHMPPLLPGYRLRIVDGNHLAATERRLAPLRGSVAGPLPGQSLVVLDPSLMLATDVIVCEDGHAQERSLTEDLLALVHPLDAILADRNFCTARLLWGIAQREAFFIIRQHSTNVAWDTNGKRTKLGRIATGTVWEQRVMLHVGGHELPARRVTLHLDKPTRDGDTELHILTNLPAANVPGLKIAQLYAKRWAVETLFQELTVYLKCEVNTLGYPKAALLAFCVALTAYNVLSTVRAALRAEFGVEKIENEVSDYYLADEISGIYRGMMVAIPPEGWAPFLGLSAPALADKLRILARQIHLPRFKKHRRGPKKPVPPRTRFKEHTHVSTAQLLANDGGRDEPP